MKWGSPALDIFQKYSALSPMTPIAHSRVLVSWLAVTSVFVCVCVCVCVCVRVRVLTIVFGNMSSLVLVMVFAGM